MCFLPACNARAAWAAWAAWTVEAALHAVFWMTCFWQEPSEGWKNHLMIVCSLSVTPYPGYAANKFT